MKNTFRCLFALAAASLFLVSCEEELIPSKDTYGKYKGVTGTYAYIVGGTNPEYDAVYTEIQHTPMGEYGTIEKTLEVALTKAQASDVTVKVAVDNNSLEDTYTAFPDGVLKFEDTVTIPAGELKAEIKVSVDNADFPSLTAPSYMAVFRIVDAGDIQVSTNSNIALLYVTTSTVDLSTNIVSIQNETVQFSIKNYTDSQTGDDIYKDITVRGTEAAFTQFTVEMTVDNSLIASYNAENGTSYLQVPDGVVDLTDAQMAKDSKTAVSTVSISEENRALLTDANGYLVPVRIESAGPATLSETSGVVYLVINVSNIDTPSNMFSALYLGDKEMSCIYEFSKGMDLTKGFIYVFHMFIDENVGQQRVCNISDKSTNWINMMRLGQRGNGEELEWYVGPTNDTWRKKLYANVSAGEWHQIVLVYNGSSYIFYVDMVEASRYDLTEEEKAQNSSVVFQAFEFANSWGDNYRSPFKGRLWNFSVWSYSDAFFQVVLTSTYKGIGMDAIMSYAWIYGLKGYWPINEGQGHILYDKNGWENMDLSHAVRCNDEVNNEPFDASPYVQWIADEHNIIE